MVDFFKLFISIVVTQVAGFLGSLATTPAIPNWYASLKKPQFTPPSWLFAPVWTLLFLSMGVALYLVWSKGLANKKVQTAILIFAIQLLLNVAWSFLFFGLRNPLYGLVEIIILWIFILLTIIFFYKVNKVAGLMLVPYLAWVSFASILNYYIFILN